MPAHAPQFPNRAPRGISRLACGIAICLVVAAALALLDYWPAVSDDVTLSYVGRSSCIDCHGEQAHAWQGSHHDRAMELATDDTVMASFDGRTLTEHGTETVVYRKDDKFMVRAEDSDGKQKEFEVKYTFGCDPLQQYMVETKPSSEANALGTVQVLRWSWDTAKKAWFHLDPPDVSERLESDDPLHWTGFAQNWNQMCADCHSTDLQKRFDLESLEYRTTFSEINVSCESCHGPGSLHAELANDRWLFWDRKRGYGLNAKLKVVDNKPEVEACAPCHSRRRRISEQYVPGDAFADHYAVQLLTLDTYYPDGQIRDEVYVYGSFLQSKMYEKGIKCSDCHNPHTNQVKFNDNQLCTSCHQHSAAKYDSPSHHHHEVGSTGASCIECHMPETPFMEIDLRRDHRLNVPRPDVSVRYQTPNACTGCHLEDSPLAESRRSELNYYADWLAAARDGDETVEKELARLNQWSADAITKWYGPGPRNIAVPETLHAAWNQQEDAAAKVRRLAADRKLSGMIRASAVALLSQYRSVESEVVAIRGIRDRDGLVRAAACGYFADGDVATRLALLTPLLQDPLRQVRIEAADALSSVPDQTLVGEARAELEAALAESQAALMVDSDLASSHIALAIRAEREQQPEEAIEHYRNAIRAQPGVVGARSNLAAILEQAGDTKGAQQMRAAELPLLERDAKLAPDFAPLQYRLGLAEYLAGNLTKAEAALLRALQLQPNDTNYLLFLALLYEKQERYNEAAVTTSRLITLEPENPAFQQTMARLHQKIENTQK